MLFHLSCSFVLFCILILVLHTLPECRALILLSHLDVSIYVAESQLETLSHLIGSASVLGFWCLIAFANCYFKA